jgi:hypothetical protein
MERTSDTIAREFFQIEGQPEVRAKLVEEYRHACQTELSDALQRLPFSLACISCDTDSPENYTEAMDQGWQDLTPDATGYGWNFVGICPECHAQELQEDANRKATPPLTNPPLLRQGMLF